MKKLVTLFATLALASTISLTGCKKKEEAKTEPTATEAPKTTEPAKTDPAVAPTDPAVVAPAVPVDPAAAPAGDVPAECNDYKAALEKVAACGDKIPAATRDSYKDAWTGIEASLKSAATPEAKAALVPGCKAGTEGLKTAAAACF